MPAVEYARLRSGVVSIVWPAPVDVSGAHMTIYPHRNLQALAASLAAEITRIQRESAPFTPVSVVSPSKTFTDWIQLEIAKKTGLSMGLNFMPVGEFLGRIVAEETWSARSMTWRILPLVNDYAHHLGVTEPKGRDRLALARVLADQFDLYAHYRPELIQCWAENREAPQVPKEDFWQRDLWAKQAGDGSHPVLDVMLGNYASEVEQACSNLLIVGAGSLDPLLVELLRRLPGRSNVQIHLCLPSLEYLGDLKRQSPQPGAAKEGDPELFEMHQGPALLMTMGRKSIGAFHLVEALDSNYSGWPLPEASSTPGKSLLEQIQDDIHQLRAQPTKIASADNSLQVHSCHGPRREMEVLRDELLRAFKEIQSLKPEEVLIVTPSLQTYAPLVSAILEHALPVRMTQLPPAEQSPVAEGLLALLEISARNLFEASSLLELIQLRSVRACLNIADDGEAFEGLRNCIIESGMTRGLGDESGAWQFGADRLMAGSWFGNEEVAKYPSGDFILSVASTVARPLMQRFLAWLQRLRAALAEWQTEAAPKLWAQRLVDATLTLLVADIHAEEEDVHLEVQSHLDFLAGIECDEAVDAGTILDWLAGEFEQSGKRSQISGQIAFGEFKHLQHVPCRVLAMVGMQEGAFPRQNKMPAWSLLRCAPKIWDRNARIDDRQLFLDALMTTSEKVIVTASSQNVRTGKAEPFSVCVDELLRTAEAMGARRDQLVVKHRLQPFACDYFRPADSSMPPSFDAGSQALAEVLGAKGTGAGAPFWSATPPHNHRADEPIMLEELLRFWKDPARAFVQSQGIETYEKEEPDLDRIPLKLDGVGQWQVKNAVLQDLLGEEPDLELTKARLLAARKLPPGALGEDIWSALKTKAELVAHKVGKPGSITLEKQLDEGLPLVRGAVSVVSDQNGNELLVGYRAGEFDKAKDYLQPWLAALLVAATGESWPMRLVDEKRERDLSPIEQGQATRILSRLVRGFLLGRSQPLCYAPATSESYLRAATEINKGQPPLRLGDLDGRHPGAIKVAAKKWADDSSTPPGEGTSRSARLAWRDVNPFGTVELENQWHNLACSIAEPLRLWSQTQSEES